MRLSAFNPKSVLMTGLVLVLIIALFFIPEIIDFQRGLIGRSSSESRSSAPAPQVVEPEQPAQQVQAADTGVSTGALDELLESNYLDRVKARQVLDTQEGVAPRTRTSPKTGVEISWQAIREKPSAVALKAAQSGALDLARELPAENSPSRFALLNYASGIGLLLQGGEKSMTAGEAVRYIEYLHSVVARTLVRDGADTGFYNRFAALSLGPVVAEYSGIDGSLRRAPFNPQLILSSVDVRAKGERGRRWVENGPIFVQFGGSAAGVDLKAIRIISNGSEVQRIKGRKGAQATSFKSKKFPARGVFAVRVEDNSGQVWEKLYAFYPRVRRFEWNKGKFDIPLSGSMLDRYFTYRPGHLISSFGGDPADPFEEGLERF